MKDGEIKENDFFVRRMMTRQMRNQKVDLRKMVGVAITKSSSKRWIEVVVTRSWYIGIDDQPRQKIKTGIDHR